jgi:hypothetical protein
MDHYDVAAAMLGLQGFPVEISELVPLTRTYRPTGAAMADVICVRLPGGRVLFHPQRLDEMRAAFSAYLVNPKPTTGELARWADDGGAAP